MPSNKYDVIIIGAGIGGLICGCYLAKEGMKVLIMEKNDRAGGCCVSFERKGFKFDAAAHIIGSCEKNQTLGSILDELGVKTNFIKFKPMDRINFPDQSINISENFKEFSSFLKENFNSEANNIDRFFELISKAKNSLEAAYLFEKYRKTTYKDLLDSFFSEQFLKTILCFGCGYLGLPASRLSALSALFLLRSYLFEGAYYPQGGAQVFSDSIVNRFKKYGGELILNSKVIRIMHKQNLAQGIMTEKNNIIKSKYIVSNADSKETFCNLVGIENIENNKKIFKKFENYKTSISFFVKYIAINEGYDLRNKNGWYFKTYDLEKEFANQIYLQIPTLFDNSVAPERKHIIIMGTVSLIDFDSIKNWKEIKEEISQKNIELLEQILPGIKKYIEFHEDASPMTIYRYTLNSKGASYGWEQSPEQVFANGFPPTSPSIKNMILAGHWTFPGGGIVSVAISGALAAQRILRKNKIKDI